MIVPIADTRRNIWIVIQRISADSLRVMHFGVIRYVINANQLKNTFNHARLRQFNLSVREFSETSSEVILELSIIGQIVALL